MAQFEDRLGRKWQIEINVATVKRVAKRIDVNIANLVQDDMKPLADLMSDIVRMVDVIYVLCEPQCEREGISEEQFASGIAGETIQRAIDTFMEELADFFPNRQGQLLRKMTTQGERLSLAMTEKALEKIDEVTESTLTNFASS